MILRKPARGEYWLKRRADRKAIVNHENAAKAQVRREDKRCRWPFCPYCRSHKPRLEVAHVVRAKGMGGDHGTVSTPEFMMLLDFITHGEQERGQKDVRPLTDRGTRGPCEFYIADGRGWCLVAREIEPFRYERD